MYRIYIFNKITKKRTFKGYSNNLNDLNIHMYHLIKDMIYLMDLKGIDKKVYDNKGFKVRIRKKGS